MRPLSFFVVASLTVAFAIGGCGGASSESDQTSTATTPTATATGVQGPSEVVAEPVDSAGDNPFTPAVGKDRKGVEPPRKAAGGGGGLTSYRGNLPGLYGGTMDNASCDARQLVGYLEATPDKAAAWARVFGIQATEIRTFVGGLTPVILRTDTRVTNHGFVNGVATPLQAVLQAGTAVFVNEYGRPVVKCYCGNPLTAPAPAVQPTYTGALWPGFSPTRITIINQSTTIINVFRLYDPETDVLFSRPVGTDGARDRVYYGPGGSERPEPETPLPDAQTPTPTTEAPPAETEPPTITTEPPTEPESPAETEPPPAVESPSAGFSPSPGHRGDTFVLSVSGFEPGSRLEVALTRPDGVVESYTIDAGSDGSGSYTFTDTGNVVTGVYRAQITNPATGAGTGASVLVEP